MSETNTPPTTGSNEPTSKHTRSAQDKMIGAYITDAKKFLNVAATDAEIRPILEAHGYGDEEFTLGNALAKTASDAFEGRASGMGHQKLTGTALIAAIKTAREDYAAFREIARASFPDEAERLALALTGGVPHDTSRFITIAETSYNAATKEPYAAKITKRGYSAERLASLLQGLNDLTGTSGNQDTALGAAIDDTAARDEAYENLKSFMKELKGTARGALRGNPGLLAKLEL
ncbi:MAG: hypothetical protein H8M99_03540 [Gloeobacteraceae cyanobacterium ES-bin-144]|nr:hypothetical protein [Verrucomicrobiales bacterium]